MTLEFDDQDGARFVRGFGEWVRWGYPDDDEFAFASIVAIDGQSPPPPPECTREHRSKSVCRKRH